MITATLLVAASLTLGQTPETPVYDHLKDLECFTGTWTAETVIPESEAHSESAQQWVGKPLKLTMDARWTPSKCAQIIEFQFVVPGEVKITETALRGWDQSKQMITGSSYTTHKGVWSSTLEKIGDRKWVSVYEGYNLDGKQCSGKRTIEFLDDNSFRMTATDQKTGDKDAPDMEYVFRKVATAAGPPSATSKEISGESSADDK